MDGRCTCGAVRYRLGARPLFTHCCHCTWCQRETGSAFVLNALIETAHLSVEGASEPITTPTESGQGQEIHRCPTCKVALWSHYSGMGPQIAFVRVGTLDRPGDCPPDIHIFTQSKLPWVTLGDDIPVMAQYYRRSAHWPDWAIARRNAALADAQAVTRPRSRR